MEEKERISKTLGYEWHYIKKKKKSQHKVTFFHPKIEQVNRLMLIWPIHKNKVSRGHESFCPVLTHMAIRIIPLLGLSTCTSWL